MILLLQVLVVCLLLQLLFAFWNSTQLPMLGKVESEQPCPMALREKEGLPYVSVLIPARDEAANIADCLSSVLACRTDGWSFEVLVLDDHSSDLTGEIASSTGDHRVQVMSGRELPEGWLGKSHACAQLAEASRGEWMLFLDADIRLQPEALQAALLTAVAQQHGLVTGFPLQQTGTWLEKLVVPLMNFTIVCHLPISLVRGSKDPRFIAAHGGFMFIHRESYARCGGHAEIRNELVDDMAMARAVKKSGDPVTLVNLVDDTVMRMYHNAREVWNGYRKNIYAGLGRRPLFLFGVVSIYFLLYILPVILFISAFCTGQGMASIWAFIAVGMGMGIKRISDASGKQPLWLCLFLPISILCLIAIAISSWRGSLPGRGYQWKGRYYR